MRYLLLALAALMLVLAACGGSPPAFGADDDDDDDDGGDADADTDGDTGPEPTACEIAQESDPILICCPDPPPQDCDEGSWAWHPDPQDTGYPMWVGCCTGDLIQAIWCEGQGGGWSYIDDPCEGGCTSHETGDGTQYMDCPN